MKLKKIYSDLMTFPTYFEGFHVLRYFLEKVT